MREILFRGKRKDTGEWVEGHYNNTLRYNSLHWMWDGKGHIMIDPETVGQYTGLTDKNGTKIFEGDIVKRYDLTMGYDDMCVVQYNAPKFVLDVHQKKWRYFSDIVESNKMQDMNATIVLKYEYEVIGNVHDNPELLEGGAGNG